MSTPRRSMPWQARLLPYVASTAPMTAALINRPQEMTACPDETPAAANDTPIKLSQKLSRELGHSGARIDANNSNHESEQSK